MPSTLDSKQEIMFGFRKRDAKRKSNPSKRNAASTASSAKRSPKETAPVGTPTMRVFEKADPLPIFHIEELPPPVDCHGFPDDNSSLDMSLYTTQSKATVRYPPALLNYSFDDDDDGDISRAPTEFTSEAVLNRYANLGGAWSPPAPLNVTPFLTPTKSDSIESYLSTPQTDPMSGSSSPSDEERSEVSDISTGEDETACSILPATANMARLVRKQSRESSTYTPPRRQQSPRSVTRSPRESPRTPGDSEWKQSRPHHSRPVDLDESVADTTSTTSMSPPWAHLGGAYESEGRTQEEPSTNILGLARDRDDDTFGFSVAPSTKSEAIPPSNDDSPKRPAPPPAQLQLPELRSGESILRQNKDDDSLGYSIPSSHSRIHEKSLLDTKTTPHVEEDSLDYSISSLHSGRPGALGHQGFNDDDTYGYTVNSECVSALTSDTAPRRGEQLMKQWDENTYDHSEVSLLSKSRALGEGNRQQSPENDDGALDLSIVSSISRQEASRTAAEESLDYLIPSAQLKLPEKVVHEGLSMNDDDTYGYTVISDSGSAVTRGTGAPRRGEEIQKQWDENTYDHSQVSLLSKSRAIERGKEGSSLDYSEGDDSLNMSILSSLSRSRANHHSTKASPWEPKKNEHQIETGPGKVGPTTGESGPDGVGNTLRKPPVRLLSNPRCKEDEDRCFLSSALLQPEVEYKGAWESHGGYIFSDPEAAPHDEAADSTKPCKLVDAPLQETPVTSSSMAHVPPTLIEEEDGGVSVLSALTPAVAEHADDDTFDTFGFSVGSPRQNCEDDDALGISSLPAPIIREEEDTDFVWTDPNNGLEHDEHHYVTPPMLAEDDRELMNRSFLQAMESISVRRSPEQSRDGHSDSESFTTPGAVLLTTRELQKHLDKVQHAQAAPSSDIEGYDAWKRRKEQEKLYFARLQAKAASRRKAARSQQPAPHTPRSNSVNALGNSHDIAKFGRKERIEAANSPGRGSTRSAMDYSVDSSIPTVDDGKQRPRNRRSKAGGKGIWKWLTFSTRKKGNSQASSHSKKSKVSGRTKAEQKRSREPQILPLSQFLRISADEPTEVGAYSLAPLNKEGPMTLANTTLPEGADTIAATKSHFLEGEEMGPRRLANRLLLEQREKQRQVESNRLREEREEEARIARRKQQAIEEQRRLNLPHLKQKERERCPGSVPEPDYAVDKEISFLSKSSGNFSSKSGSRTLLSPCVICNQAERTHIAMPCMHYYFCGDCVEGMHRNNFTSCPVCSAGSVTFSRVYTG